MSWRRRTHTCSQNAGHKPPHICPECGEHWDQPVTAAAKPAYGGLT